MTFDEISFPHQPDREMFSVAFFQESHFWTLA